MNLYLLLTLDIIQQIFLNSGGIGPSNDAFSVSFWLSSVGAGKSSMISVEGVGAETVEDDDEAFAEKIDRLTALLLPLTSKRSDRTNFLRSLKRFGSLFHYPQSTSQDI